jgi:putative transposase
MAWLETRVMDQRMKFIVEYEDEEESMAELCRRYGISRKTGYKWLGRWLQEGPVGLGDRSRAPKHHPRQVPAEQVAAILAMRDRYGWGPKKLRVLLAAEHPNLRWPAISTMEQILKDHGRVLPRTANRSPVATGPTPSGAVTSRASSPPVRDRVVTR